MPISVNWKDSGFYRATDPFEYWSNSFSFTKGVPIIVFSFFQGDDGFPSDSTNVTHASTALSKIESVGIGSGGFGYRVSAHMYTPTASGNLPALIQMNTFSIAQSWIILEVPGALGPRRFANGNLNYVETASFDDAVVMSLATYRNSENRQFQATFAVVDSGLEHTESGYTDHDGWGEVFYGSTLVASRAASNPDTFNGAFWLGAEAFVHMAFELEANIKTTPKTTQRTNRGAW